MKRILLPLLLLLTAQPLAAQKQVAILVGNGEYSDSQFNRLPTAAGDLDLMKRTLRSLGYTTHCLPNATKDEILDKMDELEGALREADVAVFYYSGHGVSYGGDVYIVPCRTALRTSSLEQKCVSTSWIASQLAARCRLSFLFLDCCRDRVEVAASGYSKGMLEVPPDPSRNRGGRPYGQMTLYATRNGRTASTGTGTTSTFTRVLASHLMDDEEFTTVAFRVCQEVASLTSGQQQPEATGLYSSHFRFNGKAPAAEPPAKATEPPATTHATTNAPSPTTTPAVTPCPSSDPEFKANWEKAHKGDAEAQFNLGLKYGDGKVIAKNNQEALKWLHKAAEQDAAKAACKNWLGAVYNFGLYGVTQSFKEAAKWFRKAAEQGDASAQFNLAGMYKDGLGVPKDRAEAVKWYRLAARQGQENAQKQLRSMGESW